MGRYRLVMNNTGKYELIDTAEKEYGRKVRLNWANEYYRKDYAAKLDAAIKKKMTVRRRLELRPRPASGPEFTSDGVPLRGDLKNDIAEGRKTVGKEATGKSDPSRQEVIDAYAAQKKIKKPEGYDIEKNTAEFRKQEEKRMAHPKSGGSIKNRNKEILSDLEKEKTAFRQRTYVHKATTQEEMKKQTGLEAVNEAEEEIEASAEEEKREPLKDILERDRNHVEEKKNSFSTEAEADFADDLYNRLNSVDRSYVRSSAAFRALKKSLDEYRKLCGALYEKDGQPSEEYYKNIEKSYNKFVKQAKDYFEYKSNPKNCSGSQYENDRIKCVEGILKDISERRNGARDINIYNGAQKAYECVKTDGAPVTTAFKKTQNDLKTAMQEDYANLYEFAKKDSLTDAEKQIAGRAMSGIVAKRQASGELDSALESYKTAIKENKPVNVSLSDCWEKKNGGLVFNEEAFISKNIKETPYENITPETAGMFVRQGSPDVFAEAMKKQTEVQPVSEAAEVSAEKNIGIQQPGLPGLT